MSETMTKQRVVRYALIAAMTAAVSFPLGSQALLAQDEPAGAAEQAAEADPSDQAEPANAAEPAEDGKLGDEAQPAEQAQPAERDQPAEEAQPTDAAQPPDKSPAADESQPREKSQPKDEPTGPKALGSDPSKVIASAGEIKVTVEDFVTFVSGMPPQDQQQIAVQPDIRRRVAEHLVKMKALAHEAEKRKLDQDEKFQEQMEAITKQAKAQVDNARLQMLASALVSTMGNDPAADKKYFEEHLDEFGQIEARHILISTRASSDNPKPPLSDEQAKKKAADIRARLVKGEDFAAIAKAESDDPGAKQNGGSLGTFPRGRMVPPFEQAAFGLKVNEISQPVKTPFGYHVIQLQKRLPATFEASRELIGKQRVENLVKDLTGSDPTLDETFFTTPPGAAARGAAGQPAGKPGATAKPAPPDQKPVGKSAPKGAK